MKQNLHFGRVCAALIAAACALSANAQTLKLESNKGFGLIPGTMTVDGKPRVTSSEEDGIHIYSPNFQLEKVIKYAPAKYRGGSREEKAEVDVTGVKVSDFIILGTAYIGGGTVSASTIEEAREKVANVLGDMSVVTIYNIDGKSFIHSDDKYSEGSWNYYLYDLFEKQYPTTNNYALEDGVLKNLSLSYSPTYNESEAVWTVVSDNTYDSEGYVFDEISYKNLDTGTDVDELEPGLTQTVFNSDGKWEYIAAIPDTKPLELTSISSQGESNNGKITLRRYVQVFTPTTGIGIYSEDGTLIASTSANHENTPESYVSSMRVRSIWEIDGKRYLEISKSISKPMSDGESSRALYLLGEGTNGVKKVMEYKLPANETDDTIYDLSGRVLNEKPAKGIYIQRGKKFLSK